MKIVGLTGGIASGKSTVSKYFSLYGVPIIDCDHLARRVVEPGHPALAKVVSCFGEDILLADGTLNRSRLGSIIFNEPSKRALLNKIMHPAIRREIVGLVIDFWLTATPVVVIDAPLLIESGLHRYMSEIIVVYCSEEIQIQRLCARDGVTEEEARKRIAAQDAMDKKTSFSNSRYRQHITDLRTAC